MTFHYTIEEIKIYFGYKTENTVSDAVKPTRTITIKLKQVSYYLHVAYIIVFNMIFKRCPKDVLNFWIIYNL